MTRHALITYCPRCGDKGHAEPDCPLTKVATSQRGERRLRKRADHPLKEAAAASRAFDAEMQKIREITER